MATILGFWYGLCRPETGAGNTFVSPTPEKANTHHNDPHSILNSSDNDFLEEIKDPLPF